MTGQGGVLLLHGHGRLGASMAVLARAARREGYATSSPNYPYRRSLGEIVDWLAPRVAAFERDCAGPLHIITHSLGGLVARALLTVHPPQRLGRVVMLAPPNAGSELADLLIRLRLARLVLGAAHAHLRTERAAAEETALGTVNYPLGIIAGDRALLPLSLGLLPSPHDGKVSVAATRVAGLTDHLTLPVTHTLMVYDRRVTAAALDFLRDGAFRRAG
jgi:triacylglycerol esterase/lipase EstA (alpha/beta hydrolase family)